MPTQMTLTKEQEVELFKALATYSITEVGYKFNLDKKYTTVASVRNAVNALKNKIAADPAAWGITQEVVDMVQKAMTDRRVDRPGKKPLAVKVQEDKDIKNLVEGIRNKTFALIDRKLDMLAKSRKKLQDLPFQQLGIIAGIAFDKMQIIKGEATENIAVRAKIDKELTPEQLLELVLKQREETNEHNNK